MWFTKKEKAAQLYSFVPAFPAVLSVLLKVLKLIKPSIHPHHLGHLVLICISFLQQQHLLAVCCVHRILLFKQICAQGAVLHKSTVVKLRQVQPL